MPKFNREIELLKKMTPEQRKLQAQRELMWMRQEQAKPIMTALMKSFPKGPLASR